MGRPAAAKLTRSEREWGKALSARIDEHFGGLDELFPLVLRELKERLELDAALCYGISTPGDFVQLEFAYDVNIRGGSLPLLRRHLDGRERPDWGYYNILRPEPVQANRVLTIRDQVAPTRPMGMDMYAAAKEGGVLGLDQIRALICEGPALVAWVGGMRQDTLTGRERSLFASILPALRKRLVLENQLRGAALKSSAFDAVLNAINCAAILLRPTGSVAMANAAGQALLESGGAELRERLRKAAAGAQVPGVEITPFAVGGGARHVLALVRPTGGNDAQVRARILGTRWGLTPRQVEVLERLAWGDSNKCIAARLECSERTVELHVAAIMNRVQVGSRAELVARFWTAET